MAEDVEVKKSMCFFCKPRCIQTVYVKDGRLVKVDPSLPSIKRGVTRAGA